MDVSGRPATVGGRIEALPHYLAQLDAMHLDRPRGEGGDDVRARHLHDVRGGGGAG